MPDDFSKPTPQAISTALIHHPYQPPGGFAASQPAVHKASTVIFPDVAALQSRDWKRNDSYTYGLHGTPTSFTLEQRIATLEGGLQTLLVPSGLAAITLVDMALLQAGDEVLIPLNAYGPGKELARHELAKWGITHRLYDPMAPETLQAALSASTRLVWIEAPGSVTMEFPDVPALLRIARAAGVPVAFDNTWGAGLAFSAFDLEPGRSGEALAVDICIQALTKYPSGGGDVLMGSVTTRDHALHLKLKATHMRMGWGIGANDVEAVLHALPSLQLRYAAQDRTARTLAQWFAGRSEVATVLHPAFSGSPGHEHWARLCTAAAGLFSVVFDARFSAARVHALADALTLFRLGYSWAGPTSLVVPYELKSLRAPPPWPGMLLRFSAGLEAAEDLLADLEQAMPRLHADG